MKKLVMFFVILVGPFAFTACTDEAVDDVKPQVIETAEPALTDDEDGDDRGDR